MGRLHVQNTRCLLSIRFTVGKCTNVKEAGWAEGRICFAWQHGLAAWMGPGVGQRYRGHSFCAAGDVWHMALITAAHAATGTVTHWETFLAKKSRQPLDFKVIIPSFDRPVELCGTTLALLQRDGVPMERVNIFVSPAAARAGGCPEWYRYSDELKRHGLAAVNVRPGGRTLDEQMNAALEWAGSGYVIIMSDIVRAIDTREETRGRTAKIVQAPAGTVMALIEHGFELMQATGSSAWSVNPSHNPLQLSVSKITRRLGLLDGNLTGMILPPGWRKMKVTKGHGLIYDVEWSASLWFHGHRFCRYQGVCCQHPYRRPGGQATLLPDASLRRKSERAAIKTCAKKFPDLIRWCRKPNASLKNMEYKFSRTGPPGLVMVKTRVGARRKYHLGSAATGAQRMAGLRARNRRQK